MTCKESGRARSMTLFKHTITDVCSQAFGSPKSCTVCAVYFFTTQVTPSRSEEPRDHSPSFTQRDKRSPCIVGTPLDGQ
jgi:hypothetical protein